MLAVWVVVGVEAVEGGYGVEHDLLALAAERDDPGGEHEGAATERAAEDIVKGTETLRVEDGGHGNLGAVGQWYGQRSCPARR
ncbi:hypothetical protein GCM10008965_57900 [Methylorubrum aminovorans]|nr:hypothetical protein GCM10025880_29920 [Methylorubrum aminovorans]